MLFYSVLSWGYLSCSYIAAAFELKKLEIYWKINLVQSFGIYKNNLDYIILKLCGPMAS
jgi:hypothetical protein